MAFLFTDPQDEEEQNKNGEGNQAGAGGTELQPPTTGSSGTLLGSEGTAPTPGQAQGPTSSGWTNLRAYLDANGPQAGDLAEKVGSQITATGEGAKSDVEKGVADYNASLGGVNPDPNDLIKRANENPAGFVKNPNDVASLKSFQKGTFTGPDLFETTPTYGDLSLKAQTGSDLATEAQSEGGQRALLKKLSPNSTEGMTELDNLLLAGVPGARGKLAAAAQPYSNLRQWLADQTTAADAARNEKAQQFGAGAEAVRTGFTEPQTKSFMDLTGNINNRVQSASTDFNKDQAIKDLIAYMGGQSSLTPDERALFEPEGANYSGYDTSALQARIGDVIQTKMNPAFDSPNYRDQITAYLLGDESKLPPEDAARQYFEPLKSELWKYSNDPLEKFRGDGLASSNPDWLNQNFGGTQLSSGNPTAASVASPDEAAKLLALQSLLEGVPSFLSPKDEKLAGTYRAANIGRYRPTIGTIPGIPGFPGANGSSAGPGTPTQFNPYA